MKRRVWTAYTHGARLSVLSRACLALALRIKLIIKQYTKCGLLLERLSPNSMTGPSPLNLHLRPE